MFILDKKPFSKKIKLSANNIESLLSSLPKLINYKKNNKIKVTNNEKYNKLVIENWKNGIYFLDVNQLEILNKNIAIKKIIKKLIKIHNLENKDLTLKSSCIFYPSNCKYKFDFINQKYIYHKYHLDSGYRIKALLTLKDSNNEIEQFSYIKKFPEPLLIYFIKCHYWSKLIVLIHRLLYLISLKKIKLSGQPPQLPLKYQDPKLYKKYNSLKLGELITFNNLYPHSSHNGFSFHHTPMLQLVFDKN